MDPFDEPEINALITEVETLKQLDWKNRDRFSDAVRALYEVLPNITSESRQTAKDLIDDLARHVLYRVHDSKTVTEIADTLQDPRYQSIPQKFQPTEAEERLVLDQQEWYQGTWGNYLAFLESRITPKKTKPFLWKKMNAIATDYARILMIHTYELVHNTTIAEIMASRDEAKKAEKVS